MSIENMQEEEPWKSLQEICRQDNYNATYTFFITADNKVFELIVCLLCYKYLYPFTERGKAGQN